MGKKMRRKALSKLKRKGLKNSRDRAGREGKGELENKGSCANPSREKGGGWAKQTSNRHRRNWALAGKQEREGLTKGGNRKDSCRPKGGADVERPGSKWDS